MPGALYFDTTVDEEMTEEERKQEMTERMQSQLEQMEVLVEQQRFTVRRSENQLLRLSFDMDTRAGKRHTAVELVELLFCVLDQDYSGQMDRGEAMQFFTVYGCEEDMMGKHWEEMLRSFGHEADGVISMEEFVKFVLQDDEVQDDGFFEEASRDYEYVNKISAIEQFNKFDENGDKHIDAAELEEVLSTYGKGLSKAGIKRIMTRYDVDTSGTIEFAEYIVMLNRECGSIDISEDMDRAAEYLSMIEATMYRPPPEPEPERLSAAQVEARRRMKLLPWKEPDMVESEDEDEDPDDLVCYDMGCQTTEPYPTSKTVNRSSSSSSLASSSSGSKKAANSPAPTKSVTTRERRERMQRDREAFMKKGKK